LGVKKSSGKVLLEEGKPYVVDVGSAPCQLTTFLFHDEGEHPGGKRGKYAERRGPKNLQKEPSSQNS